MIRSNAAKIISKLFSDVITVNTEIINDKLECLSRLTKDSWWEVRAQALIIFKSVLMSKYKN